MREYLSDLREMLCEELEEIARKREMNAGDLETIHKLTDTIKNIDKINILEEGGYSQAGDWEARGRFMPESYRGRKRDSMGRYSREGKGKHEMIEQLVEMMENAETEKEREAIRRCIDTMKNA